MAYPILKKQRVRHTGPEWVMRSHCQWVTGFRWEAVWKKRIFVWIQKIHWRLLSENGLLLESVYSTAGQLHHTVNFTRKRSHFRCWVVGDFQSSERVSNFETQWFKPNTFCNKSFVVRKAFSNQNEHPQMLERKIEEKEEAFWWIENDFRMKNVRKSISSGGRQSVWPARAPVSERNPKDSFERRVSEKQSSFEKNCLILTFKGITVFTL